MLSQIYECILRWDQTEQFVNMFEKRQDRNNFQKELYIKNAINLLENFIYLQYKEYSISLIMESSEVKMYQFHQRNSLAHTNKQKLQKRQQIFVKERKDSGCLLKGQNKVLQNIHQTKDDQKLSQSLLDIKFWRIFLMGVSLAQFSIQISVILIQYVSSKIDLALFVTFISITLALSILVFTSLKILSVQKILQSSKVSPQAQLQQNTMMKQVEVIAPTVLKIRNSPENRVFQKTQKLKAAINDLPKSGAKTQTLKRLKIIQNQQIIKQKNTFLSALSVSKNIFFIIGTKVVEKLFSLIICTLCICTIQNPVKNGFSYITFMLISFYILAALSSASLMCLCLKIRSKVFDSSHLTLNKEQMIEQNKDCQIIGNQEIENTPEQKMGTVLSIDKYIINSKNDRSLEKKVAKSLEDIVKEGEVSQHLNFPSKEVAQKQLFEQKFQKRCQTDCEYKQIKQTFNEQRKIIKKSMLKSSKSYKTKIEAPKDGQKENQIHIQRRKVQINSKKIQYFEYANISPANSERLSEDQHKSYSKKTFYEKSKAYSQRNQYHRHKLMNEDKLLQRKKQQNARRSLSKSAKLPVQKIHMDKSLRWQPSKFQQQFS